MSVQYGASCNIGPSVLPRHAVAVAVVDLSCWVAGGRDLPASWIVIGQAEQLTRPTIQSYPAGVISKRFGVGDESRIVSKI